jgi:hypothetical protein
VRSAVRSGAALKAERVTFIDDVHAHEVTADDSVFNGGLSTDTPHTGYVRYCLIRPVSKTPVRFACIETAGQMLASREFGRPRFARLFDGLPDAARTGSSEGLEIGAFALYSENTRKANLRLAIAEFLPEAVSARVEYRS